MADEVRPGLRTYEKWVSDMKEKTWLTFDCDCRACYDYLCVFDYMCWDLMTLPDHKYSKYCKQARLKWLTECPKQTPPKRVHHKGNGKPKGLWAGTLTMSPTDPYNEDDMIHAIRKLFKQETCPVEKYAWYLEYTANELPHVHFVYRTPDGGRIHAKVFKRVWKVWNEEQKCGAGHRGGYHRLVSDENAYLQYIAKDKGRHESNWSID